VEKDEALLVRLMWSLINSDPCLPGLVLPIDLVPLRLETRDAGIFYTPLGTVGMTAFYICYFLESHFVLFC
jgi:hypothetical protein